MVNFLKLMHKSSKFNKTYLQVVSTIASKEKVEAEVCIKVQRLFLKVIGRNQKMDFYYSFDGEKYNILDRGIDSRFFIFKLFTYIRKRRLIAISFFLYY